MRGTLRILFITALAFACEEDDNTGNNNSERKTTVETTADAGQWRITSFVDSGMEETNTFSNFIFDFSSGNVVTASNGSDNVMGSWTVTDTDDSNDDNGTSYEDIDFNISFSSPDDFVELSEDWEIV